MSKEEMEECISIDVYKRQVLMCEWIYLDYYFNVKEVGHELI